MTRAVELYGRPWSEREFLIVLNEYFSSKGKPRHENSDYIKTLAQLLGRTPSSIYMRMENFASVDPETASQRKGLTRGAGPNCRNIFNDWVKRVPHLRSLAPVLCREVQGEKDTHPDLFTPSPVEMPKAFGKYELLDPIGKGTFGQVYSCVHVESGKPFALKIITPDGKHTPEILHRFIREIKALRCITHPQVIRMHDDNLDSEQEFPAFIMDLADFNLDEYMSSTDAALSGKRPSLPAAEAANILRSIISAVMALHGHDRQVIHRDINPRNILKLESGSWVLADFSLAKFVQSAPLSTAFSTRSQARWGTAHFAAPEQYRDFKRTDVRTDIYALGMLIWELFSKGWPPIQMDDLQLPNTLIPVFRKSICREPEGRYQTIQEFSEAFEKAAKNLKRMS